MSVTKTTTFSETTNTSANTSDLTITIYFSANNTSTYTYNKTLSCTCNGTTQSATINLYKGGSVTQSFTFSSIAHNSDGTKSVDWSWSCATATSVLGTLTDSGTHTLTTIPRYATSTQSLKSKTSSSITMNWSSDSTIDYIWYSKDNGSNWVAVGSVSATSGSYTISNLSANSTYNIKTRVRRKDSQLTTDSNTLSVTTYAKTTPTISLSSKTSSSITVTSGCNVSVSSTQYRIKTSSGSYGSYQTSATFSGLSSNTAYVVEVKKVGSDSGESGTATLSVTTYAKTTPTISLSSRSINSITVTSGCNVSVSSTQYRIKTSSGSYGSYQTSATFSGLSSNTAYVVEVKKVGSDSGESGTATLSVTTYDYAKLSSYPNFNLGDDETITFSNPSGSTIAIGIYDSSGSSTYIEYRSISGSSYTFDFTDDELDILYKAFTSSNTLSIRIYLRTYCNGTYYYDYKTVTVTLTGNQKTSKVGISGTVKRAKAFICINGEIKKAVVWIGDSSNKARRCI